MAVAGLPVSAASYVVASGLLHFCYNVLLVRMYRSGDLGETYPVARGASPALIALGGSVFAGEWMGPLGIVGVGLVCAGIFLLAVVRAADGLFRLRGRNLTAALATGVSIAAYSVADGLGVRASGNWVAYTGGIFAFELAMPFWYLARQGRTALAISPTEAKMPQRRADLACSLRRYHLGNAGQCDGRSICPARNRRGVCCLAGRSFSQRTPDRLAARGLLHHCGRCGLRRLAALIPPFPSQNAPA